jgi:hypothetical protein
MAQATAAAPGSRSTAHALADQPRGDTRNRLALCGGQLLQLLGDLLGERDLDSVTHQGTSVVDTGLVWPFMGTDREHDKPANELSLTRVRTVPCI